MTPQTSPVAGPSARPSPLTNLPHLARRPARTRIADAAAYEALDNTHRAAQVMLQAFARLLAHLDDQGLDLEAEQAAAEVLCLLRRAGFRTPPRRRASRLPRPAGRR